MKFMTKILAALAVLALCATASAQYQQIPPQVVGPLNAFATLCNSANAPGMATECAQNQDVGSPAFTLGSGTGSCTTTSSIAGGATRGQFKCTNTAGASTVVVTFGAGGQTAANGWACYGSDVTTGTAVTTSATTTTTATLKFTNGAVTDVIQFACFGY
jgi:hypothetical protein